MKTIAILLVTAVISFADDTEQQAVQRELAQYQEAKARAAAAPAPSPAISPAPIAYRAPIDLDRILGNDNAGRIRDLERRVSALESK